MQLLNPSSGTCTYTWNFKYPIPDYIVPST